MSKYNTFLMLFILTVISSIIFFIFYFKAIATFSMHSQELIQEGVRTNPFQMFSYIFTPTVIISMVTMILASFSVRILGIVHVAKNKTVSGGEKALWIVGFAITGFVTSIVFLVMAKGKNFV